MHRAAAGTASPSPSCAKASSLGSSRPRATRAATTRRNVAAAAAVNGDDDTNDSDAKKKNQSPPPLNGYARPLNGASYAANGASSSTPPPSTQAAPAPSFTWDADAFPAYLQSEVDDFCSDWELALTEAEQRQQMRKKEERDSLSDGEGGGGGAAAAAARPLSSSSSPPSAAASSSSSSSSSRTSPSTAPVSPTDPVWLAIRREAQRDAADEPLLSSFLYASILSHPGFARSLAFVLANRLSDATLLATELMEVFESVLAACPWVQRAALHDIVAVRERDPACRSYADGMLYFKGYQAVQVHRIAHELWLGERSGGGGSRENKGKKHDVEGGGATKSGVRASRVMARMLQSRVSEVFAVDIHPAATLGRGLLLDHGTGVVIGETAVVGDNVSILQNVTLGGTGKDAGDRHPKVEDNVLIGAAATILGNITVGRGAQVAAGSLVLKPVPPRTAVAGSPAQVVGLVRGNPALRMQQWVASLDGKAAPAWESAMCPPPQSSAPQAAPQAAPQTAPPQEQQGAAPEAAAAAARRPAEEEEEEREINRKLYPRRAEEPPFVPVFAAAKANSPPPPPPPPQQQPKRPSPPTPAAARPKPKQPPAKREQEPEFFI